MTDREQALKWWETLDYDIKYHWFTEYCNRWIRNLEQMYDSEIEEIWVENIKKIKPPPLPNNFDNPWVGPGSLPNQPQQWPQNNNRGEKKNLKIQLYKLLLRLEDGEITDNEVEIMLYLSKDEEIQNLLKK